MPCTLLRLELVKDAKLIFRKTRRRPQVILNVLPRAATQYCGKTASRLGWVSRNKVHIRGLRRDTPGRARACGLWYFSEK